jgi:hypothetical protein
MKRRLGVAFVVVVFSLLVIWSSLPQSSRLNSSTVTAILTSTPKPKPAEDWVTRWLKNVVCRAPCWEGINPGQTTAEEAVEILSQSPIADNVSVEESSRSGIVQWRWAGENITDQLSYDANDPLHLIRFISLPTSGRVLHLKDVIDVYGEPTSVYANDICGPDIGSGRFYSLGFIYMHDGLKIETKNQPDHKPDLSPDLIIASVNFYDPNDPNYDLTSSLRAQPWQGYLDFYHYSGTTEESGKCPEP